MKTIRVLVLLVLAAYLVSCAKAQGTEADAQAKDSTPREEALLEFAFQASFEGAPGKLSARSDTGAPLVTVSLWKTEQGGDVHGSTTYPLVGKGWLELPNTRAIGLEPHSTEFLWGDSPRGSVGKFNIEWSSQESCRDVEFSIGVWRTRGSQNTNVSVLHKNGPSLLVSESHEYGTMELSPGQSWQAIHSILYPESLFRISALRSGSDNQFYVCAVLTVWK